MSTRRTPPPPRKRGKPDGLESLVKSELVARAESLGIDGARKFTKVELVDEIRRARGKSDRGLLGKARELLKDVVDKGLRRAVDSDAHAPAKKSAAHEPSSRVQERAQQRVRDAAPPPPEPPVPTVTLAEIYLAQGHPARARAILREVLRVRGDDEAARALLARIDSSPARPTGPTAATPASAVALNVGGDAGEDGPSPDDPYQRGRHGSVDAIDADAFVEPVADPYPATPSMLDDEPWPPRYDTDECVAMAVDPTTLYVYWETRSRTGDRARRVVARAGEPIDSTLRVLVVEPGDRGPRVATRDFGVIDLEYGEYFVRDLPPGAMVRAAIGVRSGDRFLPIAHTVDVEAPPVGPSATFARDLVVWSESATVAAGPTTDARPPRVLSDNLAARLAAGLAGGRVLHPAPPDVDPDEWALRGTLSSAEFAARGRRIRAAREKVAEQVRGAPSSASWLDGSSR